MALGHAELQHFCFHEMSFCSFEHSSLNLLQIRRRTSSRPEIVSNFRDWFDLGKHCIWYPWLITETLYSDENLHARHMSISWSPYRTASVSLGPEFFDPSFSPVAMWWQKGGAGIGLYAETWQHKSCLLKCCRCELLMNHFCSGWHLVQSWKRNFEPSQVFDGNSSHFLKHDDWLVFQMRLTLS